jgi:hypothetical protein
MPYMRDADGVRLDSLKLSSTALKAALVTPPVSAITRDGSGRITGFTEGASVYRSITRNPAGFVTSYVLDDVTHTVSRDANNRVTGVS